MHRQLKKSLLVYIQINYQVYRGLMGAVFSIQLGHALRSFLLWHRGAGSSIRVS